MAESTPYLLPNTQGRYVTVPVTNTSGEVYRINDDGTRTIYADYFVENGNTILEASTFSSPEFQNNLAQSSQGYRSTIGNSIIQASGSPTQTAAPNPDSQGGSTPMQTTPATEPPPISLKYPLTMEDGQDKIQFTPLELVKTQLSDVSLTAPIYKKPMDGEEIFIGIQGSITDQNSVTWGSGELNEIQKDLVNTSLSGMKDLSGTINSVIEAGQQAVENDKKTGALGKFKGLGQLYAAEQATGVGGLLSRASGSVLNPNLELLFQAPTLRTFAFQFKMSPRNKEEADTVKKIIRTFKRRMAAKRDADGLFLKAPNVFKIKYLKGMELHKSINLIKVCALLNFAVDYTPNGTYMTFGGGDNGDEEASMVTYSLSFSFQEIEPIYESDYTEFRYGDGGKKEAPIKDHPIGA